MIGKNIEAMYFVGARRCQADHYNTSPSAPAMVFDGACCDSGTCRVLLPPSFKSIHICILSTHQHQPDHSPRIHAPVVPPLNSPTHEKRYAPSRKTDPLTTMVCVHDKLALSALQLNKSRFRQFFAQTSCSINITCIPPSLIRC